MIKTQNTRGNSFPIILAIFIVIAIFILNIGFIWFANGEEKKLREAELSSLESYIIVLMASPSPQMTLKEIGDFCARISNTKRIIKIASETSNIIVLEREQIWIHDDLKNTSQKSLTSSTKNNHLQPTLLSMTIHWNGLYAMFGEGQIYLMLILGNLFLIGVLGITFYWFYVSEILPLRSEIIKIKPYLHQATRFTMMAHDFKKPFSSIQIIFDSLTKLSDPGEIKRLAGRYVPEIRGIISDVENLLRDILFFDSKKAPELQIRYLGDLLRISLERSVMAEKRERSIGFVYSFSHSHALMVDDDLMVRAFSNIVSNAIQAIPDQGTIWFRSKEKQSGWSTYVILTIGNSDSYIDEEDINNLFDPYFTKKKHGGTGLGLAIAKKIVEDQGGWISVRSKKDYGTEFVLGIPAAKKVLDWHNTNLPTHCFDISREFSDLLRPNQNQASIPNQLNKPMVVVIDDDVFVREAWATMCNEALIRGFCSPEEFFNEASGDEIFLQNIKLVISDFSFSGASSYDGHTFAEKLRDIYSGYLIISSDASQNLDHSPLVNCYLEKRPRTWQELTKDIANSQKNQTKIA